MYYSQAGKVKSQVENYAYQLGPSLQEDHKVQRTPVQCGSSNYSGVKCGAEHFCIMQGTEYLAG